MSGGGSYNNYPASNNLAAATPDERMALNRLQYEMVANYVQNKWVLKSNFFILSLSIKNCFIILVCQLVHGQILCIVHLKLKDKFATDNAISTPSHVSESKWIRLIYAQNYIIIILTTKQQQQHHSR